MQEAVRLATALLVSHHHTLPAGPGLSTQQGLHITAQTVLACLLVHSGIKRKVLW